MAEEAPIAPSVYLVLCLGGFLGGVTKGVTGFGNAIINLLIWVSLTAAGVNGGTLLQAVLADAAACLVVSIPLLVMTRAHKTADWRLVFVMLVFLAAGSPIGAALLTHMDPRTVEGVMAAVLLLVILVHVKLPARAAAAVRGWRQRRRFNALPFGHYGIFTVHPSADYRAAAYGKLHEEAHQQSTSSSTAATSARDPGQPEPYRKSAADAEGAALHGIAVDCLPSPLPDPMQQREDSPSADPHSYGLSLIASAVPEAQSEAGALRSSGKGSAPVARRLFGVSDQAFGMDAGGSPPADPAQQKDLSVTSDMHQSCQGGAKLGGGTVSPGRAVAVVVAGNKDFGSPAGDGSGLSSDLRPTKGLTGSLMGPFSSTQGQRKLASSNGRAELPLGADSQPLLGPAGGSSSSATSFFVHGSEGNGKAAGEGCGGAERGWGVQALAGRARRWAARQDWREWRRIVGIGSVASLASGVMAGMTGIGGPPLMYMYDLLKVEKDVVRGTNAVMNVLQVRMVTYIVMGVFRRTDMPLYGAASSAAMVGVALGNVVAGRMDQQAFSRVLVCLMVICCLLLFAAAAGLTHK